MLLNKQKELAQWSSQHKTPISPELIHLWDQAMSLGEEKGKKVYQDFLNKWHEYQKNPPKYHPPQQPSEWQKQLLQKQQEIMQVARRQNITIPRDVINLWEHAMSAGEKDGKQSYDEFLKKWQDLEKAHQKTEPLAGQYVNRTNQWGYNYDNQQTNQRRDNRNENQQYTMPYATPYAAYTSGDPTQQQQNNQYTPQVSCALICSLAINMEFLTMHTQVT